ncbi:cleavage and polyadenylation [Echinococcus multilocularis]|uniref:Cleavage and polyadenylation specificity factor subunit 2 n=1 Tax=Echinococcus multilocularis TaxID=6211 RepID=A0A087W0W6_ECHMU|nr:cleavage and polyadenylation [Echinococcus multilocularis]
MATSIIKLHTFSGAGDSYPPCFILQVDDFYCLLDCGWSENLPRSRIAEVGKWAKRIGAVLISHPSMRHLGLLPILVGKYGLKCPVYSTTPIFRLGQLFCYDEFQSRFLCEDFSLFSLDDVDDAFELFVQVKYSQTINLQGKGRGLSVTPLPSGHMLGGTIWKAVKDETDIIYAIDFNNEKSRHLNGAAFDACIRPRLLIIDVSNALYTHVGRKDRNEALRQLLLKTLRRGGNVLVAVDTAGYCLEIAYMLESLWHSPESGFMAYGLAMLSHVGYSVFDFTKSLVEWMSERILRSFEDQRCNPFHLRHMQLCHTADQLDCVSNPRVILATDAGLRTGFSRLLFVDWADNELNTVVITSRDGDFREAKDLSLLLQQQQPNQPDVSLARRLIGLSRGEEWAHEGLATASANTLLIPFDFSQRVLVSEESDTGEGEGEKRNSEAGAGRSSVVETTLVHSKGTDAGAGNQFRNFGNSDVFDAIDDLDNNEDDTEDDGDEIGTGQAHASSATSGGGTGGSVFFNQPYSLLPSNSGTLTHGRHMACYDIFPGAQVHSGGQFFRSTKRTQPVFPTTERVVQWDEYGEKIDTNVYRMSAEVGGPEGVKKRHQSSATSGGGRNVGSRAFSTSSRVEKTTSTRGEKKSRFDIHSASSDQLLNLLVLQNISSSSLTTPGFQMPTNIATKCMTVKMEIPLRCDVSFIDYESRSDGKALRKIITGLRPHEVILVGATRSAIDAMVEHCRSDLQLKDEVIHTPLGLDVVNCTKEGDIYQARMKDSLVTGLRFTKIREYELAWVDADILEAEENANPTNGLEAGADGEASLVTILASDALPVLAPPSGPVVDHPTVFVNEPKLSDMKQLLLNQGLQAEFVSGVLVVDNCVSIKRTETGRMTLEGVISPTYFVVRDILYRQFAIL